MVINRGEIWCAKWQIPAGSENEQDK